VHRLTIAILVEERKRLLELCDLLVGEVRGLCHVCSARPCTN